MKIGLLLRQNTAPTSTVADVWAGSVFYFSHRYGIDMLGKMDRHIARMPAVTDGTKPGHNKFDFDHSLGVLKPDIVIASWRRSLNEEALRQRRGTMPSRDNCASTRCSRSTVCPTR